MGFIKDVIGKFRQKKEKEQAYEEDIHIQERVMEKKKSANERELEGYMREAREKQIKYKLDKLRKQKMDSMWKATLMKNSPKCYIDNSLNRDKKNFLRGGF
jgi:hypothetical protein